MQVVDYCIYTSPGCGLEYWSLSRRGVEDVPVDLVFELSYMLSDLIGREVVVEEYRYDRGEGMLCVTVRVDSARGEACIPVRQCRTMPEERLEKCLAKALASNEKLLRDLAGRVAENALSQSGVVEGGVSG